MADAAVVNASPLLVLARSKRLPLLKLLGDPLVVPDAVAAELRAHSDEAARAMEEAWWLTIQPPDTMAEMLRAWDLGAGESAVLSWAMKRPGTLAVLDDFAARKCATALGIPVVGTLGVALLAKKRGVVQDARPLVEDLRRAGLYLSDAVIREALALVGE